MTPLRPLRDVRTRLLAIVLCAIAVGLGAATLGFNVLFENASSSGADTLLRSRADSERDIVKAKAGHLSVSEPTGNALDDSNVWVFDGSRAVEAPRARPEVNAAARALAGGPARFVNVHGTDIRLYASPVVADGRRLGTIVTGLSLAPYDQTERTALAGSLALALLVLVLIGVAVYLLLRSALRPVARMTEQAAAWSEADLDRRFELGPPHDELTRLAATLDGLLDRIAASLRHERRFSAELSHELRTPLAKLITEAELTLRRDRDPDEYRQALERILRSGQQLARTVDTLFAAAQQEGGPHGTADCYTAALEIVDACGRAAKERGVELRLERPEPAIRVGVDEDVVERILQPVVENACKYGSTRVRISVDRRGTAVAFVVEDDGPGVAAGEEDAIFEPGTRGAASYDNGDGAGLGLALARRLARAATGDVHAEHATGGRFVVTLPRA
ncbi:MAG: sensor histidine kinase [Verrucomicrobiota bacterium]